MTSSLFHCCFGGFLLVDIPYLRPSLPHIYVILLFFSQMSVRGCRSIMCQKCSTSHQDVNAFGTTGSFSQLFLVRLFDFFLRMKDLTVHFLMGLGVNSYSDSPNTLTP